MTNKNDDNKISLEPKDDYDERVAISKDDKDECENLLIYDVITGSPSEFDITTVSEDAMLKAEDVPEQSNADTHVFRLVPKEESKFVATSLNYFENHIGGNRHVFGLQPAPDIREQYTAWVASHSNEIKYSHRQKY